MDWFPDMFWLFLEWWVWPLLGLLAGLAIGWWFWRRPWKRREIDTETSLREMRHERAGLRFDLDEAHTTIGEHDASVIGLKSELSARENRVLELEPLVGTAASLETERATLETERDGLRSRVADLEGELASTSESRSGFEGQLVALRSDLDGASTKSAALESDLTASRGRVDLLEGELADAQARVADLEPVAGRVSDLESELSGRSEAASGLQAELDASTSRIGELETELAAAQNSAGELTAGRADLEATIAARDGRIAELESESASIGAEAVNLRSASDEQSARVGSLEADLEAARAVSGSLQADLDERAQREAALQADLDGQAARLGELEAELGSRDSRIAELTPLMGQVASGDERVASLEADLEAARAVSGSLQADLDGRAQREAALEADLEAARAVSGSLQADLDGQAARLGELEAELGSRDSRIAELSGLAADHDAKASQLGADLQTTQGQLGTLEGDLANARVRVGELEGELSSSGNRVGELEAALSTSQARLNELEGLRGRVDQLEGELSGSASRIGELEGDLAGATATSSDLAGQVSLLRGRVDGLEPLETRVPELEVELQKRQQAVGTLESDVVSRDTTILELQAALDAARAAEVRAEAARAEAEAARLEAEAAMPIEVGDNDAFAMRMASLGTGRDLGYTDDLKEIKGVGPKMEEMLHSNGLRTFYQVALLDQGAVNALEARIEAFPGRIRRDDWVPQAAGFHLQHHNEDLRSQVTIEPSPERQAMLEAGHADFFEARLAAVAAERNLDYTDDLKEIKGVGPKMEEMLHSNGLRTFYQVALLDDASVDDLEDRIDTFPGRVRRDDWVPQAGQLHRTNHAENIAGRVVIPWYRGIGPGTGTGLDARLSDINEARSSDRPDDLKPIKGVGKKMSDALAEQQIITFYQLALLDDSSVAELAARIEVAEERIRDENWIPQAAQLHFESYDEAIYDLVEVEAVYTDDFERQMMENARGRKFNYKDDLKLISGVGPKMEKMLNGAGLTTFLQVSLLKGPGVGALNDRLEFFPGRIERDDWVGQAAKFHTLHHG